MCLAQAVSPSQFLYQCWTEHEQSAVAGTGSCRGSNKQGSVCCAGVHSTTTQQMEETLPTVSRNFWTFRLRENLSENKFHSTGRRRADLIWRWRISIIIYISIIFLLSVSLHQCTCVHNPEPELATLRRPHTRFKERAQPDRLVLTASKEMRNSADFILVRQILNYLGAGRVDITTYQM